jgi:hypothetical protein
MHIRHIDGILCSVKDAGWHMNSEWAVLATYVSNKRHSTAQLRNDAYSKERVTSILMRA